MLTDLARACLQGNLLRSAFIIVFIVTLAACGGGGSGSNDPGGSIAPPTATNLQFAPANPLSKDPISFTALCTGSGPLHYSWDFGDGSIASEERPTHTYATHGSYKIKLTCTDAKNQTARLSTDLVIQAVTPPTVQFSTTSLNGNSNKPMTFKAIATSIHTGVLNYSWDFGDGTVESGVDKTEVIHSFNAAKLYKVQLTVSDTHGGATSISTEVGVDGPIFSQMPKSVSMRFEKSVNFSALALDSQNKPVSYRWDFGDGTPLENGQSVSHIYAAKGNYTVKVAALNDLGGGSIANTTANIVDNRLPTVPELQVPSHNEINRPVTFSASSVDLDNDTLSYSWDFGDGEKATGPNPGHRYLKSGQYTVSVSVSDGIGSPINSTSTVVTLGYFDSIAGRACSGFAAGTGWCWQQPSSPTGAHLNNLKMVNAQQGWLVGASGALLHTNDGGTSWQQKFISGIGWQALWGISTVETQQLWVVGTDGLIAYSADGGTTWKNFGLKFQEWLISISTVDGKVAWAVGGGGLIRKVRSADNESIIQQSNTNARLYSINMVNNLTGWVVGTEGTILRTIDGGENWVKQASNITTTLRHVSAIDANIAFAAGDYGILLKTTDGGVHWEKISTGITSSIDSITTFGADTIWLGTMPNMDLGNALIVKSINGGISWNFQSLANRESVTAISAIDANTAIVLMQNRLYKSSNGLDWQQMNAVPVWFNSMGRANSMTAWAVGSQISKTTDGGMNWVTQYTPGPIWFTGISVVDEKNVWTTGIDRINSEANSLILRTIDGGSSWATQYSGTKKTLNHIAAANNDIAWVVGENGLILRTDNGGLQWQPQTSVIISNLRHLAVVNKNVAWAVGDDGVILKTTDGGGHWQPQVSGTTAKLMTIEALDENRAWAGGYDGIFLRTEDGGRTWVRVPLAFSNSFVVSIGIIDANNLWIAGEMVYRTHNGGTSWNQQFIGDYMQQWNTLLAIDEQTAWLAGSGSVLRTATGGY